jgi:hypothetical protein
MRRRGVASLVALSLLFAVASCSDDEGALVVAGDPDVPADYNYVIPDGTGDRIRAGEDVSILPKQLDVAVGETIRIVNEDGEGHFVGIFYVGADETVTQRFSSPGEYTGQCTIHPSGTLTLRVHR